VDDDVTIIIEHQSGVVEIHEIEDDDKLEPAIDSAGNKATKSIIESISKSNSEENINKISTEHTQTSPGKEVGRGKA